MFAVDPSVAKMAMLKQPRFRLSADPSIGVTDLMEPLSKYMEGKGDRNLIKLLHVSPTFSGKSAPDITFLSEHAPLFQRYAKIAPNSMLPPKKNKTAIERLDQQMKCNFSKQSTSDYVDLVDNIVRTAMKQYRDLAKDPHAKERAYRRADSETQEAINPLLVLLHKCDSRESDAEDTPPPPGPLAIMDKDPEIKVVLPDPPPPPRKPALRISPKKLFQKIVNRPESEDEDDHEFGEPWKEGQTASAGCSTDTPSKVTMKKGASFLMPTTLDSGEENMLEEAFKSGPVENLRKRKTKKKKEK